ncbi:MAG: TonB-dependent receptor [Roseovarius sp.]|nr:TonB-dependent receptor [Roseovarius sp.]
MTKRKIHHLRDRASFDRQGVFRENDDLAVKLTYFDTELWDVTSATDLSGGTGLLDEINIEGLEIEASYAMTSGFYVDLNATITDADERTVTGVVQDYGNTPQDGLRLTVGKVFDDTYDLSWEAVFGESITINGDPGAFASGESYDVHNLRLTVAPRGKGVWEDTEFRLGIENLFDEQYTPNLATRSQPGRNFKLTLAKTF